MSDFFTNAMKKNPQKCVEVEYVSKCSLDSKESNDIEIHNIFHQQFAHQREAIGAQISANVLFFDFDKPQRPIHLWFLHALIIAASTFESDYGKKLRQKSS